MSRFNADLADVEPMSYDLWAHNAVMAFNGKRGQKALRELREALLALPEKRLIAGAFCTVDREPEDEDVVRRLGEGVCAVAAYAWWKRVRGGMDPTEAFESLPTLDGEDAYGYETADYGKSVGLTYTMAWEIAYANDEDAENMTPEERYEWFLRWIDARLIPEVAA